MSVSWTNFYLDPVAFGTLFAAISGIIIALGIELHQRLLKKRQRRRQTEVMALQLHFALVDLNARVSAIGFDLEINLAVIDQERDLELAQHYLGNLVSEPIHRAAERADQVDDGIAHNIAQLSGVLWMYQHVSDQLIRALQRFPNTDLQPHFNQVRPVFEILQPLTQETLKALQITQSKAVTSGNRHLGKVLKSKAQT